VIDDHLRTFSHPGHIYSVRIAETSPLTLSPSAAFRVSLQVFKSHLRFQTLVWSKKSLRSQIAAPDPKIARCTNHEAQSTVWRTRLISFCQKVMVSISHSFFLSLLSSVCLLWQSFKRINHVSFQNEDPKNAPTFHFPVDDTEFQFELPILLFSL
jgi:hypothetical protein